MVILLEVNKTTFEKGESLEKNQKCVGFFFQKSYFFNCPGGNSISKS